MTVPALLLRAALTVCLLTVLPAARAGNQLHNEMEAMNKVFRQLRRDANEGKSAKDLAPLISKMREHAVNAQGMTPGIVGKAPADQKDRYREAFQKGTAELVAALDALGKAASEGRDAEFKAGLQNLTKLRDKWHTELKVED